MEKEIIKMSREELMRLEVIQKVIDKRMKQKEAAKLLSLSTRQIRRMKRKVKSYGSIGLIHGNRGKPSSRKFSNEFRKEIISIVKQKYYDFGPTFASEKLKDNENKKNKQRDIKAVDDRRANLDTEKT